MPGFRDQRFSPCVYWPDFGKFLGPTGNQAPSCRGELIRSSVGLQGENICFRRDIVTIGLGVILILFKRQLQWMKEVKEVLQFVIPESSAHIFPSFWVNQYSCQMRRLLSVCLI